MKANEDRERIHRYLQGDSRTVRELEGWIRQALEAGFPGLRIDPQDLCQTVHQKLLVNLRQERYAGDSSLKTYVSRISRYTVIDLIRRRYRDREREAPAAPAAADPYRSLEQAERGKLLHAALHRTPEGCRELWRMVLAERLSYREIGHRLGVAEGTVKSRLWRCRQKLRAIFERLGGSPPD